MCQVSAQSQFPSALQKIEWFCQNKSMNGLKGLCTEPGRDYVKSQNRDPTWFSWTRHRADRLHHFSRLCGSINRWETGPRGGVDSWVLGAPQLTLSSIETPYRALAEIKWNLRIGIQPDCRKLDTVLTLSTTFLVSVAPLTAEKQQKQCRSESELHLRSWF